MFLTYITHSYIDDVFFTSNEPLEKINQMLDEARDGTGTGDRPVRSGPGPNFVPAGLPVDRSRPADWRPIDLSFFSYFFI